MADQDKLKLVNGAEMDFSDALYKSKCPICGEGVEWEANFDADGTTYSARCCKQYLRLSPLTVRVSVDSD